LRIFEDFEDLEEEDLEEAARVRDSVKNKPAPGSGRRSVRDCDPEAAEVGADAGSGGSGSFDAPESGTGRGSIIGSPGGGIPGRGATMTGSDIAA
jgi:hypothetical protein